MTELNLDLEKLKAFHFTRLQKEYGHNVTPLQMFNYLLSEISILSIKADCTNSIVEELVKKCTIEVEDIEIELDEHDIQKLGGKEEGVNECLGE